MENIPFLLRAHCAGFSAGPALTFLALLCAVFVLSRADGPALVAIRVIHTGRAVRRTGPKTAGTAGENLYTDEFPCIVDGSTDTEPLPAEEFPETGAEPTEILCPPVPATEEPAQEPKADTAPAFAFTVTRQIMLTHTEEQV